MNNICIIVMIGNSERNKHKNIKLFFGRSIIYWSLMETKDIKCFNRIIVSTECKSFIKIAKKYGVEIFFFRLNNLLTYYTGIQPVLEHNVR